MATTSTRKPGVKRAAPAKKAVASTAAKAAVKAPAKTAPRKVAKPAALPAAKPVAKAAPAKPAKPVKAAKPAKVAKPAKPAAEKPRAKLVRDSFTMPDFDFALIDQLKARAMAAKRHAKKSELLRAGLQALAALAPAQLLQALERLAPVKTGRPKKGH